MTEQEKRGKAIEEMASDVRFAMRVPICDDNGTIYGERMTTSPAIISERLLNIGYRKEEEVRKETAKEILTIIASDFYSIGDGIFELTKHDIQELMQEFGVEVEE